MGSDRMGITLWCKLSLGGCAGKSSEEKHKMENQGKKAYIDIDMFADQPESDVPDMFSGGVDDAPVIPAAQRRLQDNYDDPEGYYNFQVKPLSWSLGGNLAVMQS